MYYTIFELFHFFLDFYKTTFNEGFGIDFDQNTYIYVLI